MVFVIRAKIGSFPHIHYYPCYFIDDNDDDDDDVEYDDEEDDDNENVYLSGPR